MFFTWTPLPFGPHRWDPDHSYVYFPASAQATLRLFLPSRDTHPISCFLTHFSARSGRYSYPISPWRPSAPQLPNRPPRPHLSRSPRPPPPTPLPPSASLHQHPPTLYLLVPNCRLKASSSRDQRRSRGPSSSTRPSSSGSPRPTSTWITTAATRPSSRSTARIGQGR